MRFLVVTFFLHASILFPTISFAQETSRRNVVFILVDDLSAYGVSAYGSKKIGSNKKGLLDIELSTPHIDQLAAEGLLCERAFAYPLCEPTRIALMTGKHNNRNYIKGKSQHASDITFGDLFKRAGYATGMAGKWKQSRGTKDIPAEKYLYEFGWDEFCVFDLVKQGNRFFNPDLVINGEIKRYDDSIDPETGRRWFGPDICNRFALNFLDKHKNGPFFLYYPLSLVHNEDEGNYHVPSPETDPKKTFDEFDEDFNDPEGNDAVTRKYFPDMIRYTDTLVGNVVKKINDLGLRENTLIVLMADNGTQRPFVHILNDGTRYSGLKGKTTDHGMRVPLIFSQPGTIKQGSKAALRRYDGMIDIVDIHPTLCEAAGIELPNAASIDGISFWPQVLGKGGEHRDVIYTYYPEPFLKKSLYKEVLEFAADKTYKRYAPHTGYPRGRFFDIAADSAEVAGKSKTRGPNFKINYHSGLDLDKLTPEQQKAFERLGKEIEKHRKISVTALKIDQRSLTLTSGKTATLKAAIIPANATMNNVIWESSDPRIASIDKYGVVTAHRTGSVKLSVYSWQDARPLANNSKVTYSREGISDSIQLRVK